VSIVSDTLSSLAKVREQRGPLAIVGFSGGEDSRVVLDLATRTFDRVIGVFLELVPGLQCNEERLAIAGERWGVQVIRYPSPTFVRCRREGVFCFNGPETDNLPEWSSDMAWKLAMRETGAGCVLTGEKNADGMRRRRHIAHTAHDTSVCHPIMTWRKYDVRAYLNARKIPRPATHKGVSTDIDMSAPSMLWLDEHYPNDVETIERQFPFVRAAIYRDKWYGSAQASKD
jgi:PP-loop superfamily ATP-utilizing enzyme